jgi:hypothetical protein
LCLLALPAVAADRPAGYPAQPVRLVVPFPPGGTSDIVARVIGQRLSTTVGQRFVVENRPGAGAAIGIVAIKLRVACMSCREVRRIANLSDVVGTCSRHRLDNFRGVGNGRTWRYHTFRFGFDFYVMT